jgi:hypothetical protein
VTFCNVPAGPRLLFSVLLASLQPGPIQSSCGVGRNEVLVREVLARRPTTVAGPYPDTLASVPVCQEVRQEGAPRLEHGDEPYVSLHFPGAERYAHE